MKSLAELRAIRERMAKQIDLRESGDDRIRVVVGMATCGIAAGARPVLNAFLEEVDKRQLKNVTVSQTGCIGVWPAGAHRGGIRARPGKGHLCEDDPG